ncbi:YitT family protein [Methylibium sp.]|uniref:YitT family protein n=1 Tax=Methylibium sp. TaxID=2067992 RepID=UPI003D0C90CC
MTPAMDAPDDDITRHSALEDAMALLLGTAAMALGIAMFQHAGLLAGGTAGLAFLLHYASGLPFGPVFFAINLPFYWLAWRHLGHAFTLKTFAAVALLSIETETLPRLVGFAQLQPLYAALMGGTLIGMGMLALFRHQASIGGVGIVAIVLQEKRGWRAGTLQMALDCSIVALAFAVVAPTQVLLSVAGAVALNLVLAINHRPGRYVAR